MECLVNVEITLEDVGFPSVVAKHTNVDEGNGREIETSRLTDMEKR